MKNDYDSKIVDLIAFNAIKFSKQNPDQIERCCWLAVHEYHHGFQPYEYDIREIDEKLYLLVLERISALTLMNE